MKKPDRFARINAIPKEVLRGLIENLPDSEYLHAPTFLAAGVCEDLLVAWTDGVNTQSIIKTQMLRDICECFDLERRVSGLNHHVRNTSRVQVISDHLNGIDRKFVHPKKLLRQA